MDYFCAPFMRRFAVFCLTCLLLFSGTHGFSQTQKKIPKNPPNKELVIKKAKGLIQLDGELDEQDWKDANVATNFYLNYPVDTAAAPFQSEVRLTFSDHALYVSYICYDDARP